MCAKLLFLGGKISFSTATLGSCQMFGA